jgi:hypothetical protein
MNVIQENSVNLICMASDRFQIIKYSGLSDDTLT